MTDTPLDRLKYHVTGAIERGEKTAITAMIHTPPPWKRVQMKYGWRIIDNNAAVIADVYQALRDQAAMNSRLVKYAPGLYLGIKKVLETRSATDLQILQNLIDKIEKPDKQRDFIGASFEKP